ncbi:MAG: SsrA-binding protein SmpB [Clostridiales Family XIII bacterium]|jgi:SsrA-binding protein|nr:SsrA-binding protein SmpB [Clostridiales Family XIII bacterium]
MGRSKKEGLKVLTANRSARHDYYIEEKIEAGVELTGTEIKSLRSGRASLAESYVKVQDGEAFLIGMHISPYELGNIHNVDPMRVRRLLLHKKEIAKLAVQTGQQGLTVVPLRAYLNNRGIAKVEIAVARGKKLYDKREAIAANDAERRMQRVRNEWGRRG